MEGNNLEKPEGLERKAKEEAAAGDTEIEEKGRKETDLTMAISEEPTATAYCIIPSRYEESPQPKGPSLEECCQELAVQMNPLAISVSENQSFVQNYRKQYGEPSLEFFVGDLRSAYEAACNQPDDEKKVLAIYLHHSGSVLTNTLCHQVLKNDEVLTTFNNLFIVYGWDMSNTTDANFFHEQLWNIISVEAAEAAKNLKVDQMPAFLIIGQSTDGRIPNIAIVDGDYDDDTLQTRLQLEYSLLSGLYD